MTEFSNLKMTRILIGRLFRWHKPFRYQKDYDNALRVLNVGSWYFLYYALEGPNAEQVCVALNKCMKELEVRDILEEQLEDYKHISKYAILPQDQCKTMHGLYQCALSAREAEKALRHDLNVLIYGKDTEGCGYESD